MRMGLTGISLRMVSGKALKKLSKEDLSGLKQQVDQNERSPNFRSKEMEQRQT